MELQEALNTRKSVRTYTGEQISDAQLDAVLNAAYEAPIGMGKYTKIRVIKRRYRQKYSCRIRCILTESGRF